MRQFPHFIIAGAPRSATTWLWTVADRHPSISMAQPARPEPKFFLIDELYARGLDYYAQTWFNALPGESVRGEKSANYMESADAAERIGRDLQDVKLIFLLRNPVDRAYSNFLWSRHNGVETESSFLRALQMEPERERAYPAKWKYSRPHSYLSRGLYAEHLERFFDRFSRDQILILKAEDVTRDPRSVASAFERFVGVKEMPDAAAQLGVINAIPDEAVTLPDDARVFLEERYGAPNARLQALLGPSFEMWN